MELAPDVFWGLTVHEFWIKEAAFRRKENRAKAEAIRHALRLGNYKDNDKRQMEQAANALTRYPFKRWTLPDGMTEAQMEALLSRTTLRSADDGQSHDEAGGV